MSEFKLVRAYLLSRLDAQGAGSGVTIVESERRQRCEMSYGSIHMIWIAAFGNCVVASLPPNAGDAIKLYLQANLGKADITDKAFIAQLKPMVNSEARCYSDLMFACDAETLAPANPNVTPVRITGDRFKCSKDIHYPAHCLPDGIVYAVVEKDKIVSVAYAHQTGEYQDIVADIGVESSKSYRQRGYARACVNAVARHVIENGGESLYKCSPDNLASINTTLSAGYKPYGKSLIFFVTPEEK